MRQPPFLDTRGGRAVPIRIAASEEMARTGLYWSFDTSALIGLVGLSGFNTSGLAVRREEKPDMDEKIDLERSFTKKS